MRTATKVQLEDVERAMVRVEGIQNEDKVFKSNIIKEQRDMDFEIDRMKDSMNRKVNMDDHKRLEEKFMHYTPVIKFMNLENSMTHYAKRDHFENMKYELEIIQRELKMRTRIDYTIRQFEIFREDVNKIVSNLGKSQH